MEIMQTTLRTVRIKSGYYLSVDGQWKIQRMPEMFPARRRWEVSRMMDGQSKVVQWFPTLAAARMFVCENIQGWWG
jgi:hypothetical protein